MKFLRAMKFKCVFDGSTQLPCKLLKNETHVLALSFLVRKDWRNRL